MPYVILTTASVFTVMLAVGALYALGRRVSSFVVSTIVALAIFGGFVAELAWGKKYGAIGPIAIAGIAITLSAIYVLLRALVGWQFGREAASETAGPSGSDGPAR